MAKKELAIRLLVEEKEINKMFVVIGEDVLSQDELDKRFFNREPLMFDVSKLGEDAFPIIMAFAAIIEDDNREKGSLITI